MALQRATGFLRGWTPAVFMGGFAILLTARLFQLQVLDHHRYAQAARSELSASTTFFSRRGTVLDRNGNALAISVDTWDVYVNSRSWSGQARNGDPARALGEFLHIDADALRRQLQAARGVNVVVARDVEFELGTRIANARIPGVTLMPNTARVYPEGDLAATVLGFIGQDNTGLAGIETSYNEALQGRPGRALFERDTTGDPIPFGQYIAEEPDPGRDLVLTIDRHLQRLAEASLSEAISAHSAKGGAVIMMDPSTGEILALASSPGFAYSQLNLADPRQVELFRNRTVTDLYEPGSVMKVVTAAAALDRGVITPDTTYVDNGVAYVYDIPIKNWDDQVYGLQTMTGVLQHSINTGAIFMVQRLGQEQFHRYLDAFGFGRPTGIDLTGEAAGIIRKPSDKDYSPVDVATQAFGQSISVTPIQMISAVAAAINGGNLMRPHLVKAFISPDGARTEVKPQVVGRAISGETSNTIRAMLQAVVNPEGGFHPGRPRDYVAGGKSGTANVPIPNGYDDRQVASFIGFAPVDDPRILIMVKLDQNADLMTGTQAAAPVFARLADESLHYLGVRPDAPHYVGSR